MDEDEFQRIVSGAAGALADTWKKTSDFINNPNFGSDQRTTVEERYYSPEGWHWLSEGELAAEWIKQNPEIAEKILMGGIGAAAGPPPGMQIISALYESRELLEDWLNEHFDIQREDSEGKGEVSGADVPLYTPYDPGEFTFHTPSPINPAHSRSPTEPGIGASSQTAPSIFWIDRTHPDGGYWLEGGTSHWMTYPGGGGYWSGGDIPDEAVEYYDSIDKLESDWQLEYDAAKEAFDRRNEEEERLHREEYDKMVADMLAEQELEASMDTDFSTGDLGQGSGLSPTGELLKMLGDYFNQDTGTDGWNEPAESTPPSWLTVD